MYIDKLKLWIPINKVFIPPKLNDGRHNSIIFYGENVDFFDVYNKLKIQTNQVRYFYVPIVDKPIRHILTPEYRNEILSYKLRAIPERLDSYIKVKDKNFFFDITKYLSVVDLKFRINKYNSGRGYKLYTQFINKIDNIPSDKYLRTLIYSVDIDKPLPEKFYLKKIFPLYYMLYMWDIGKLKNIPFDQLIINIIKEDKVIFLKVFDIKEKNNIKKLRSIIMNIKGSNSIEEDINKSIEIISNHNSDDIDKNLISMDDNKYNTSGDKKLKTAVNSYINNKVDKSEISSITSDSGHNQIEQIRNKSIIYSIIGDHDKADKFLEKINDIDDIVVKNKIINDFKGKILEKEDSVSSAKNIILESANISKITESINPSHIFNKRKNDFKEHLVADIGDAFSTLEQKDIPLKVTNIEVKEIHTGPSEIHKTIKDRYFITLEDEKGEEQSIHIDLPHLTENGTFLVNGLQKILIMQMVRFPIFFPTIDKGRFESSYSTITINSKKLQSGSYFIIFLGSYKIPIIQFLSYKYGFVNTLNNFGVKYKITNRNK